MSSANNQLIQHVVEAVETIKDRDLVVELCAMELEQKKAKAVLADYGDNLNQKLNDAVCSFIDTKPDRASIFRLIKALETIKTIRLTVAFYPAHTAISQWHAMCQEMVHAPVSLMIIKDKTIAGGANIEMDGRLFRYSLGDEMEKL